MPKELDNMVLLPVKDGFCNLCGSRWVPKPDSDKVLLPEHVKYGLWNVHGGQAIFRGSRKAKLTICSNCLISLRYCAEDIMDAHLDWIKKQREDGDSGKARVGAIGLALFEAWAMGNQVK